VKPRQDPSVVCGRAFGPAAGLVQPDSCFKYSIASCCWRFIQPARATNMNFQMGRIMVTTS